KHPQSEPASHSYFNRAKLHQNDGNLAETLKAMREFIAKYPDSDQLYRAYDYIQQIQIAEKQPLEAIATLEEYVTKKPEEASAPSALLKISNHWKKYGEEQGPYLALDETKRTEWRKGIDNSIAAAEKIIEQFPESPEVALALQVLLANQKLQVKAKLTTEADIETYFTGLAKKYEGKATTKSKIVFALAGFLSEKDMAKAVETMSTAYDPNVVYSPADLDLYGTALIEQKKYDEAQKVFDKLASDYPVPPGMDLSKAPRAVWEPQSIALYGTARILQEKGKTTEAKAKFEELKTTYPYSLKLLEADYGIAAGLAGQKKNEEALRLLAGVSKRTDAPVQLRAKSMLLLGKVLQADGKHEEAINNYIKISTFFEGVPDIAAEGLWLGAQLQEKQASGEIPMPVTAPPAKKAAAPAKPPAAKK
ncbi:MAG TPA: tetratricopeptide repeat protein, partial [Fimbriimonadaceae bacterium]|nr:tetratricopeptide repeat protein [Fimbriimonadaceae bacterium]